MFQRMEVAEDWAMIKCWKTPDLLEKMVPHLDSSSILTLTEVNTEVCSLIVKVLKSESVWDELIKRTCRNNLDDQAGTISDLGKILSKMDNPDNLQKKKDLELALLHLLCSSHLPAPYEKIKVSCPCKDASHSVSVFGFRLLEMVESAIGSTEQSIEEVSTGFFSDHLLSALGTRMNRQAAMIGIWNIGAGLSCSSLAGVKNAQILLNKTLRINWGTEWDSCVEVEGDIGEEGWTALASGLQPHPGFKEVEASREFMLQAPRAALKIIWDALGALGTASSWQLGRIEVVKDGVTEEGDELKWAEFSAILGPQ